jgi:PAS domain S-box-containing protein
MIRVLYVDDEEDLLILGKEFLEMSGEFEVDTLDSAKAAQERLVSSRYDAIVSDYQMPEVNGIEFLKRLRSQGNHIPFVLFTGRGREEVVIEALNAGANFYLQKGGKVEALFVELEHKLKEAVKRREAEMELARLNRELLAIKEISKIIIHARTEKGLLEETCRIACEAGGYLMAWVGYLVQDEGCSIVPVAWAGNGETYVKNIRASWADVVHGQGPTGVAARTGKTTFIQDWEGNESMGPWRKNAIAHGYRSSISLPIVLAQGTVGVLSLYSGVANGFTKSEICMLEEMVDDLAYGIENLRIQEEKAKAEAAMRESEEKFYTAFHGSVAAMCLLRTRDDILLDVNERYARMIGFEREDIIGRRLGDLGVWSDEGQATRLAAQFRSSGQIIDEELALLRRDGSRLTALFSAKLVSLRGEEVILASQIDITGRKIAEKALELERRRFAGGMDMAHMAYWEYDAVADQYTFDDRFYALLGTSIAAEGGPHKTYQQYFKEFVHPDDQEAMMRQVQAQVDSDFPKGSTEYEHRVVRRDGQVRYLLVKAEVIRDGSGRAVRTVGVNQDITEQKAATMRLEGSERDFRAFVEESAEGLSLMNDEGRMTEWNAAMTSITGIPREEAL